ncbi:MAG: hypothetical protein ACP5O0_06180 [Acidimicrobiales bacterium]
MDFSAQRERSGAAPEETCAMELKGEVADRAMALEGNRLGWLLRRHKASMFGAGEDS